MTGGTGAIVSGFPIICSFKEQCYIMDLKKKNWTFLTNMTKARSYSSSVEINGSLFVTGGRDVDSLNNGPVHVWI